MFINTFVLQPAVRGLTAVASRTAQSLRPESSSESARIDKLQRAVELLEKQNAEPKAEVNSLKTKQAAYPPEGKLKEKVTYDGKRTSRKRSLKKRNRPFMYSSAEWR